MEYLNSISVDDCVGRVLKSKSFGDFKVLEYKNYRNVTVEFLKTGYRKVCGMKDVKTGAIKDIKLPTIYGEGFVGSKYKTYYVNQDGKKVNTTEYEKWRGLLRRCYSEKERDKFPAYRDCKVSSNFKSYEFFYEWFNKQVGSDKGFELDKDLLFKGNKTYSEDTCVLLPKELNNLLTNNDVVRGKFPVGVYYNVEKKKFIAQVQRGTGIQCCLGHFDDPIVAFNAYKAAKEEYIKLLAEKWKNSIDKRAYDALIRYEVEVTD